MIVGHRDSIRPANQSHLAFLSIIHITKTKIVRCFASAFVPPGECAKDRYERAFSYVEGRAEARKCTLMDEVRRPAGVETRFLKRSVSKFRCTMRIDVTDNVSRMETLKEKSLRLAVDSAERERRSIPGPRRRDIGRDDDK